MHPIISLFGFNINAYFLSIIVSFIIASAYFCYELLKLNLPHKDLLLFLVPAAFLVQSIGGTFIPYLYHWLYLNEAPSLKSFNDVGRYFHSIFLSMLAFLIIISKILKWPSKKIMDIYAVAAMLMCSIGRIGCLLQGCCYGKPTSLPWGMRFPDNPSIAVHPTQIYMFIAEMVLFFILLRLYKNKKFDGEVFWRGVLYYSIYRFLIEFFRINPIFVFGLTHAQVFSCFSFVLALFILDGKKETYEKNLSR